MVFMEIYLGFEVQGFVIRYLPDMKYPEVG
jgi:hypothetical protein